MTVNDKDQTYIHEIPHLEGLDEKKEKGRGAFGAVYEVKLNGLPCIAKGLHDILVNYQVSDVEKQAIRKRFFDECNLLGTLKHPNIVQFLGVHRTKEDVFLVMEYMHMDLGHCLETFPNIPLSFKSAILQDIMYGLQHLHSQAPPIIHRDLTASNILLTEGMRAKIADLGVSKMFDVQQVQRQAVQTVGPGTPAYMPPEALKLQPSYDVKLDIFSFGVLLLFTAIQVFPIPYEPDANDIAAMKIQGYQISKRKYWIEKMGLDHPFHDLTIQCLQDNPDLRPSTKELGKAVANLYCRYKEEWKNTLEVCFAYILYHKMERCRGN